jgi:hypothetical protein
MRAEGSTRNQPSWITVLTLTALLVLGLTGVQEAAAKQGRSKKAEREAATVSMEQFCGHTHVWGGNGTTHPTRPYDVCPASRYPLIQAVFCTHLHRFAANNTTFPSNDPSMQWCKGNPNPATQVPRKIYCEHIHQNAGSNTTHPVPPCH